MLDTAIGKFAATQDESQRIAALGQALYGAEGIQGCSIYKLDPSTGTFVARFSKNMGSPKSIPAPPQATGESQSILQGLIEDCLQRGKPSDFELPSLVRSRSDEDGIQLNAIRYKDTLFTLVFADCDTGLLTDWALSMAVELTYVAYTAEQNKAALEAQDIPIDLSDTELDFSDSLRSYLQLATGFSYCALRVLRQSSGSNSKALKCTVLNGWESDKTNFDFTDYHRYPPFARAIEANEPTFQPTRNIDELDSLWLDFPQLKNVQSFCIFPIVIEPPDVGAVLSVASPCRFDFTPTTQTILTVVAKYLGFNIGNRRLQFERSELLGQTIDAQRALDTMEVLHDATHRIRNELVAIPETLDIISKQLAKGKIEPSELSSSRHYLDILEIHDAAAKVAEQMESLVGPAPVLQTMQILEPWNDAIDLLQYRITRREIEITHNLNLPGPSFEGYKEQICQVFFHLILNSINAFDSRSISNPSISLKVEKLSGPSVLRLRYKDNFGGIDKSKLRSASTGKRLGKDASPHSILERGVTGRPKGTGNGMWIVQSILHRHFGGIEILEHRGPGTVFEISIATNIRSQQGRKKVR